MANKIQAIFFDYGGTLDSIGLPWKEHFESIYRSIGVIQDQAVFDRAFYDADDSLTEEGLDAHGMKDMLDEQVGRVLSNLHIQDREIHEKVVATFSANTVRSLEANQPVLEKLKKKYKLGIISNFYGNLEAVCQELELMQWFDAVTDSRRVGHTKPHEEIFDHALKRLGVTPGCALMVGDSFKRDMLGAKAMGMPHVFLVSPHKQEQPQSCCDEDLVITNLADLLEHF
jgi:putative hydrolase of the HAD superfamily